MREALLLLKSKNYLCDSKTAKLKKFLVSMLINTIMFMLNTEKQQMNKVRLMRLSIGNNTIMRENNSSNEN